ncbi:MAG: rhomboid family intramembrane serine protease [Rhizobiaceae bacterium]
MFIPIHDANALKHIKVQYVTIGLIVANVVIFFLSVMGSEAEIQATVLGYGFIPAVAFDHAVLPPEYSFVPASATYVTYAFLHGDIFHLGGNMLFLWVFGDNIEDALGHLRFLLFYMLCAVAGAFLHGILLPESQAPLIGASGAVAGIVAAYLILHPRVRIWVLAFARIPLRIPAWIVLALWIGMQFFMLAAAGDDGVSWAAHVGGILMGAALVLVMRRSGVPLFDREIVTPEAVETTVPLPRRRPPGATPLSGRR